MQHYTHLHSILYPACLQNATRIISIEVEKRKGRTKGKELNRNIVHFFTPRLLGSALVLLSRLIQWEMNLC